MSMMKEFKDFVVKGNVLDLAVGLIIGLAFGKVVTSMVNDIVTPPIGLALGHVNFSDLFINLSSTTYPSVAAAKAAGAPTINYGMFLNTVIEFVIIAFVVFLIVKGANRMRRPAPPPVATSKECPYCLSSIAKGASRCPNCTSDLKAA